MTDTPSDRCIWSNRRGVQLMQVRLPSVTRFGRRDGDCLYHVMPEHEGQLRAYNDKLVRWGRWHFPLLAFWIIVMLAAAALNVPELIGGAVIAMGLQTILLPFSTPETITSLGMKASITFVRVAGATAIVTGVVMLVTQAG